MLVKRFKNLVFNKNFLTQNKTVSRFFSFKTDTLKEIINNEVKYEKENYSPVDENEIKQFKNSTKFEFVESETKAKMELRKREGDYEVIVTFHARPPVNSEEQEGQTPEQEGKFTFYL